MLGFRPIVIGSYCNYLDKFLKTLRPVLLRQSISDFGISQLFLFFRWYKTVFRYFAPGPTSKELLTSSRSEENYQPQSKTFSSDSLFKTRLSSWCYSSWGISLRWGHSGNKTGTSFQIDCNLTFCSWTKITKFLKTEINHFSAGNMSHDTDSLYLDSGFSEPLGPQVP